MTAEKSRLMLLDAYKLLCVFFISIYHVWMVLINEESFLGRPYPFLHFLENTHGFLFNRAGLWLTTTSFFLFGTHGRFKPWKVGLFIFGMVAFQWSGQHPTSIAEFFSPQNYTWGMFSLILVAYLILWSTKNITSWIRLLIHGALIALLLVPHSWWLETLESLPSGLIRQALVGEFTPDEVYTGWFLLPWLGVLIAAYDLGQYLISRRDSFSTWHLRRDNVFALSVIISIVILVLRRPEFTVGPKYNHSIFWVEPLDLIAVVLIPFFIYRIAFLEWVRKKMAASRLFLGVSSSGWARHLWLCYILNIAYLVVLSNNVSRDILQNPWVFQLLPLALILAVELQVSLSIKMGKTYSRLGSTR